MTLKKAVRVVLISTYDLGHQPFGLASAAAWLRDAGHDATCIDFAVEKLKRDAIEAADFIGFYLPMHTATRLAAMAIGRVREITPHARLFCFGLYAPLNAGYLHSLGVEAVMGGEFEAGIVKFLSGGSPERISLGRQQFVVPERTTLPGLGRYSRLHHGGGVHLAGYTEASRGCKHLCRHCPVVPVYNGTFRVVQPDIVLSDIRQQVAAGARHITFGDPDFFNGPAHARRIVEALHFEFPGLTYDATIKIEHLLRHRELLPCLRATGCLFVTSAVESLDDSVLAKLEKGHTRADFLEAAELMRAADVALSPTFIAFTPWTTRSAYTDLLRTIERLGLVDHVSPIQLALRLLIPGGSRLLELDEVRARIVGFDQGALLHRWQHADPAMDVLASDALRIVNRGVKRKQSRREIFAQLCDLLNEPRLPENFDLLPRSAIPYMDEPWYC